MANSYIIALFYCCKISQHNRTHLGAGPMVLILRGTHRAHAETVVALAVIHARGFGNGEQGVDEAV